MTTQNLVITNRVLEALRAEGSIVESGRACWSPEGFWSLGLVVKRTDGRVETRPLGLFARQQRREFASLSALIEQAYRIGLAGFVIEPPPSTVKRNGWR